MSDETNIPEDDPWAEALQEQAQAEAKADGLPSDADIDAAFGGSANERMQMASFDNLKEEGGKVNEDVNLEVILDIPVNISMEIGRTHISIRNLLQLNQGSVVELDRLAGEPMDVLVNGTLIARGEVVVVNEKFGVRLTDIISPADRVKKLR